VKKALSILSFILLCKLSNSQYYYRGDLLDEKHKPVPNVNIYIHSTKVMVSAGSSGSFGIMSPQPKVDTFTFSVDGYEKLKAAVYADKYNNIKLTLLGSVANLQKNKLSSFVKDFQFKRQTSYTLGSETYNEIIENDFIDASKFPTTAFAVNSDRASYSNIRRFINMKGSVPTNAVRIDEMYSK
jgi:Ca-activated chloride channel homolog